MYVKMNTKLVEMASEKISFLVNINIKKHCEFNLAIVSDYRQY